MNSALKLKMKKSSTNLVKLEFEKADTCPVISDFVIYPLSSDKFH